jgi:predicted nucleotidyltransferase
MHKTEAISRLQQHEAELKRLGVVHLYLFGSTARDEAHADSDVDLFLDHNRGELGLYGLMDIKETAHRILGQPADIMTRSSLHPGLRKQIEASAVRVF